MAPLSIVFVSSHPRPAHFRDEGSFVYRCDNLGLGLSALGQQVSRVHLRTLMLAPLPYDVAVFQRPSLDWRLNWVLSRLRRQHCLLLADHDDLLFDVGMAASRPAVIAGQRSVMRASRQAQRYADALHRVDAVTLSTQALMQHHAALWPQQPRLLLPNAVYRPWRDQPRLPPPPFKRITYFSGTSTHDRDFALVERVLRRLLDEHADLRLQVVGKLGTPLQHARLERLPRLPFAGYRELVRAGHLNIAPLEDTPFNRCKSAIKAIESGCFDIPTVASPIGDFMRLRDAGVKLAEGEQQWYDTLSAGLDDAVYPQWSQGLAARLRPLCDVDLHAQQFLDYVQALLAERRRR